MMFNRPNVAFRVSISRSLAVFSVSMLFLLLMFVSSSSFAEVEILNHDLDLGDDVSAYRISPDGRYAVYASGEFSGAALQQLHIVDLESLGTGISIIRRVDGSDSGRTAYENPAMIQFVKDLGNDDHWLVLFMSDSGALNEAGEFSIKKFSTNDSSVVTISRKGVLDYKVTADGKHVVYRAQQEGNAAPLLLSLEIASASEPNDSKTISPSNAAFVKNFADYVLSPVEPDHVLFVGAADAGDGARGRLVTLENAVGAGASRPSFVRGRGGEDTGDFDDSVFKFEFSDLGHVMYAAVNEQSSDIDLFVLPEIGAAPLRVNEEGVNVLDFIGLKGRENRPVFVYLESRDGQGDLVSARLVGDVNPSISRLQLDYDRERDVGLSSIALNGVVNQSRVRKGGSTSEKIFSIASNRILFLVREFDPDKFVLYSADVDVANSAQRESIDSSGRVLGVDDPLSNSPRFHVGESEWSPDGESIVFWSNQIGVNALFSGGAGERKTQLTPSVHFTKEKAFPNPPVFNSPEASNLRLAARASSFPFVGPYVHAIEFLDNTHILYRSRVSVGEATFDCGCNALVGYSVAAIGRSGVSQRRFIGFGGDDTASIEVSSFSAGGSGSAGDGYVYMVSDFSSSGQFEFGRIEIEGIRTINSPEELCVPIKGANSKVAIVCI